MNPETIKSMLRKRGYLMADIARECEVSNAAVRNTIFNTPFPSPKVRQHISNILSMPVDSLWPEPEKAVRS